ncbi:unnamed protein product, partial [Linum tenue]
WETLLLMNKMGTQLSSTLAICTILFTITAFTPPASSSPPEPPVKCTSHNTNCTVTNSYGNFTSDRSVCRAGSVAYPATEAELISVVANGTRARRKMKVTTRFSHSMPKLVCPDGTDGLLISTDKLDRILEIDPVGLTVTVQSGVLTGQLYDALARAGLALAHTPYLRALTVGGMISTHAHGSTFMAKGGAPSDYVVGVTIVSPGRKEEGYVKVRQLTEEDEELDAARVSLGVLGVISKITLKVEPLFKRSISFRKRSDTDLAHRAISFGRKHEFADISWYPYQHRAVYRNDDRVPLEVPGDGAYDFFPMRRALSSSSISSRATGNNFTGYPIIGYHHKLQASGSCFFSPEDNLKTSCSWDPRIDGAFFHQTTFTISLPLVAGFIRDVQRLVAKNPKSVCAVDEYNGILVRFHKGSTAYLGKTEDAVGFDFSYYRSRDPLAPRLHEDAMEEIEQMALFRYNATPHWAKNRRVAFEGVISKYGDGGARFLRVREDYDPLGLFSSEWTDYVLGLGGDGPGQLGSGCALDGLCVCREDLHCAPEKGYFCRPGRVYKAARFDTIHTGPNQTVTHPTWLSSSTRFVCGLVPSWPNSDWPRKKGNRRENKDNEKMSPILRRTKIPPTFIPQLLRFASRSIKSFRFPGEPLDSSSITYGVHVFQCPDARGIVAKLSDCIASRGGNILGADVFVPENKEVFYSRSEFIFDHVKWPRAQMEEDFMELSRSFNATRSVVRVPDLDPKYKIAILASKQEHCLTDMLHGWQDGKLPVDIVCVIRLSFETFIHC